MTNRQNIKRALWISVIYLIFGSLWIYLSDTVVATLTTGDDQLTVLQTYKGWFFILVTALLLYLLSYQFLHKAFVEYQHHIEQQNIQSHTRSNY